MRALIMAGLVLSVSLFVGACAPTAAPTVEKVKNVPVTLTEFKIELPITKFEQGVTYNFIVTNQGTVNHDFSVAPPAKGEDAHGAHGKALAVINAAELPPGATKSVQVKFSEPTQHTPLEIACHTPGHYEAGMAISISVN